MIEIAIGWVAVQALQKHILPGIVNACSKKEEKKEKPPIDRKEENKKLRKKYGIEEK